MTLLLWLSSWSNISVLGVFLAAFTVLLDFMKRRKKWSRYPPGPVSLPFVGTMPYVNYNNPILSFQKVSSRPANTHSTLRVGEVWPKSVVPKMTVALLFKVRHYLFSKGKHSTAYSRNATGFYFSMQNLKAPSLRQNCSAVCPKDYHFQIISNQGHSHFTDY